MTKEQTKYTFILLGVLDLVSFLRTYKALLYTWDNVVFVYSSDLELWDKFIGIGIPVLNSILVLLLLASGLLLILGKRMGIIIYYFEFPLRLLFITLTFGFILKLSGLQYDSWTYKVVLAFIGILELLRLVFSIWTQRNYFRKGQAASP